MQDRVGRVISSWDSVNHYHFLPVFLQTSALTSLGFRFLT
jgi:hypothetical protein